MFHVPCLASSTEDRRLAKQARTAISMGGAKPFGFPKTARLRTQADYDRVHATGLKFHGRYLLARVAVIPAPCKAGKPPRCSRLGLRVAKRHGSAVERNRIKRLLREGFRRSQGDWEFTADVVLIPKTQGWGTLKLCDLQEDFERLERQIRRFAQESTPGPETKPPAGSKQS